MLFCIALLVSTLAAKGLYYRQAYKNLLVYNQLEGDTLWKVEEDVYSDCKLGFYVYGPKGERSFYDNTTDKYVIDLETGEVYVR